MILPTSLVGTRVVRKDEPLGPVGKIDSDELVNATGTELVQVYWGSDSQGGVTKRYVRPEHPATLESPPYETVDEQIATEEEVTGDADGQHSQREVTELAGTGERVNDSFGDTITPQEEGGGDVI